MKQCLVDFTLIGIRSIPGKKKTKKDKKRQKKDKKDKKEQKKIRYKDKQDEKKKREEARNFRLESFCFSFICISIYLRERKKNHRARERVKKKQASERSRE